MYFVYILQNHKGKLYVGSTKNLNNRIHRHNSGEGAQYTKQNKNFSLVYKEEFGTLLEARRREKQIKGWSRKKKKSLIELDHP